MTRRVEIRSIDYNDYVDLVGITHFTIRSLNDAYRAIRLLKLKDIALELDWDASRSSTPDVQVVQDPDYAKVFENSSEPRQLWEKGFKEKVISNTKTRIESNR